jgi:hypothetical protein
MTYLRRLTMPVNKESIVSAQVITRPASGQAIGGRLVISTENIAKLAPSPSALAVVTAIFRSKGFKIGPFVGISFSVTGAIRTFEELFGMQIRMGKDHAYEFVAENRIVGHELTGDELPEELREFVQAVAFPLPPEFGPTKFHL